MEGDYHVGQVLDALKELNIDDNTLVVFASDNGPTGMAFQNWSPLAEPDNGSPGPFRGALGEATEGSIRTFCFIRWPGHVQPNTTSYAMFSIMDFMPTFAAILGKKLPTDRPIDGVDQTDVLTGKSEMGNRQALLSFVGPDLVAARFKQWRLYFRDMAPTGTGQEMLGAMLVSGAPMWFPKVYNVEMDPHEDINLSEYDIWVLGPTFKVISQYEQSLAKYPNPPAGSFTKFGRP